MTIVEAPLALTPVSVINVTTDVSRSEWLTLAAADRGRLDELSDGRQFVVPVAHRRGAFGPVGVGGSYPQAWGCGGLVGPGLDVEAARVVLADVFASGGRVRLRPNRRHGTLYDAAVPEGVISTARRAHVATLSSDGGTMWTEVLSGKTRQAIRKAERDRVTVESDSTGRHLPIDR